MSTTTIDLPEELSERVRQAAERAGLSQQGFILLAIEEKTRQEARRYDFEQTAEQRYEQIQATGESLSWSDMRRYLENRAAGTEAQPPKVRKIAWIRCALSLCRTPRHRVRAGNSSAA